MRTIQSADGRQLTRCAADVELTLHQAAKTHGIKLGTALERGIRELLKEKGIQA